jgi:hypothetical protein
MTTLQVKIHNQKARKILNELAELKLISIKEEDELFVLSPSQHKRISTGRKQIKNGSFRTNDVVMKDLKKWLKGK